MPKALSAIGEFHLIERLNKILPRSGRVHTGIGDDTAVIKNGPGKFTLITTDMLVEGVHFKSNTEPGRIGHKALACSISDIAAMGGRPLWAVVSLGIQPRKTDVYVANMYRGIRRLALKHGVTIVGGDTVKSKQLVVNVTLVGEVSADNLVKRGGAGIGHYIFVTGALGGSLKSGRHLNFQPRVAESQYLIKHYNPSSMIDVSDGLAADLGHILQQSGKGAVLNGECIPCHKNASLAGALYDGEDFELLFTLPPNEGRQLLKSRNSKLKISCIGTITREKGKLWLWDKGTLRFIKPKGYTHF